MEVEISCPGCQQTIRFSGEPPRFCQNCGKSLGSTESRIIPLASSPEGSVRAPDETVMPGSLPTSIDATIAPTTPVIRTKEPPAGKGETVGNYELISWLGSGGMGTVWEAVEKHTGRRVALKRLSKDMSNDDTYVKRFIREAQTVAQISHPKVTFIYGSGSEDGQPFIAMELMPGRTLEDKVQDEGPLEISTAADNIIDVVEGLTAAHKIGMIHRDVKPSNCFLDTDESVKVGDFGLSKSILSNDVSLTQTGTFMGTPSYAAPEQIRGGDLDGRTDVYSTGATLFYLLTGKTPFRGDAMSITAQIIADTPPSMRETNPEIPKGLDAIVLKCLAKEPSKRFQTLEELRLALVPYASKQDSIIGIGRRVAALMIDKTLIYIVYMVTLMAYMMITTITEQIGGQMTPEEYQVSLEARMPSIMILSNICLTFAICVYFGIFEGSFGCGLGKRILGLRVIDSEGQNPGFFRSFLRAFGLPGVFGLSFLFVLWSVKNLGAPMTPTANVVATLSSTSVYVIGILICVSTMRSSNGLRGLHGIVSGTRVIPASTQKLGIRVPVVLPKPQVFDVLKYGPYQSTQMMGESEFGKVLLGRDEPLNRDVWIIVRENGSEPKMERINLARVTRQRWLEGGFDQPGNRWDAFEAVNGVPIQTLVGIEKLADWSHYQQVMIDIVEEVREALNDGTLPETLTLPQVWLDKEGHARLLDRQLVDAVSKAGTMPTQSDEAKQSQPICKAVNLVQQLGDLIRRTCVLPESAQEFIAELQDRPQTESTLAWAANRLKSLSEKLPSLQWDSRIGILGVTLGLELPVYLILAGLIYLFCFYVAPIPNSMRLWLGIPLGLVIPTVLGYLFRGGPVFHWMGVQVCNAKGLPASKLVCAIRSALSWLPLVSLVGFMYFSLLLQEYQHNEALHLEQPNSLVAHTMENPELIGVISLAVLLFSGLAMVGLLVAIVSPTRGLVDWALRTRVLPK